MLELFTVKGRQLINQMFQSSIVLERIFENVFSKISRTFNTFDPKILLTIIDLENNTVV